MRNYYKLVIILFLSLFTTSLAQNAHTNNSNNGPENVDIVFQMTALHLHRSSEVMFFVKSNKILENYQVQIVDSEGNAIADQSFSNTAVGNFKLNIEHLKSGAYNYSILMNGEVVKVGNVIL
jgi:hypothetical protein